MTARSPFHAGELAVQTRLGVRERVEGAARTIRDYMPDQHRELFEKLPYLLLGIMDDDGYVWATLLAGAPGLVKSPDARTLHIRGLPSSADPVRQAIQREKKVGLLGIELDTRRRNRANGRIQSVSPEDFVVHVEQSFGNCPKYIQPRSVLRASDEIPAMPTREGGELSEEALELIARSDTFFIASTSLGSPNARADEPREGVDVSHRGGAPGFVRSTREGGTTLLTWPDYRGNNLFNTIGNLEVDPRAGLLFIDFEHGTVLSLTGTARVLWDGPDVSALEGAQRAVRFELSHGVRIEHAFPLRWSTAS